MLGAPHSANRSTTLTGPLPHQPRADPAKESERAAADPAKFMRRYEGVARGGAPWAVDVVRERFLGPGEQQYNLLYCDCDCTEATPIIGLLYSM